MEKKMSVQIGNDWDEILKDEWKKDYYIRLRKNLINEYKNYTIVESKSSQMFCIHAGKPEHLPTWKKFI